MVRFVSSLTCWRSVVEPLLGRRWSSSLLTVGGFVAFGLVTVDLRGKGAPFVHTPLLLNCLYKLHDKERGHGDARHNDPLLRGEVEPHEVKRELVRALTHLAVV